MWGEKLSTAITSSIRETIASPVEAILPTFLSVRPSTTPTVSEEEKVILELKRDMDLLRNEMINMRQLNLISTTASLPAGAGLGSAALERYIRDRLALRTAKEEIVRELRSVV